MANKISLKDFTFFKDFSNEQANKIALLGKEEKYAAGTLLYQKGHPARSLYLIEEGKVALFMTTEMGTNKPPMQVTVDMITKVKQWAGRPSWNLIFILLPPVVSTTQSSSPSMLFSCVNLWMKIARWDLKSCRR